MKVASLGFTLLFGSGLFLMLGSYGGFGWWLFLAILAFVAGRVWAFGMWFVFKNVYAIDEPEGDESKRVKQSGADH
jgi:uncharacterized membrane protein